MVSVCEKGMVREWCGIGDGVWEGDGERMVWDGRADDHGIRVSHLNQSVSQSVSGHLEKQVRLSYSAGGGGNR